MTLLAAINAVCDDVSLDRFASIISNADALQMLRFANEAGEEIGRRGDWAAMFATDTATATASHNVPANFQRLIPGGAVYTDAGAFVRPVSNHGEWRVITLVQSSQPFYFVTGTSFNFSPLGTYTINYVTNEWCQSSGGGRQTAFAADDDVTLFPERLLVKNVIWRWKRQMGLPFEDQLAEFEADLAQELAGNRGSMA